MLDYIEVNERMKRLIPILNKPYILEELKKPSPQGLGSSEVSNKPYVIPPYIPGDDKSLRSINVNIKYMDNSQNDDDEFNDKYMKLICRRFNNRKKD